MSFHEGVEGAKIFLLCSGVDNVLASLSKEHDGEEQEVPAFKPPTTVK